MKRLTKIGILIFVMSLLIIYVSSLNFQNSITGSSIQILNVLPHNSLYASFNLTNTTVVGFFYYTNGSAIDFLLLNRSGFSSVSAQIGSSQQINETGLEGRGAIELVYNSAVGVFPYQQMNETQASVVYGYNSSVIFPAGDYYAVFDNPGPSTVQVSYSVILKSQSEINDTIFSSAASGLLGAAFFFGGLVMILYSIMSRPKKERVEVDEEAERMYAEQAKPRRHGVHGKKRKAKK
jgi:hypothetical protein